MSSVTRSTPVTVGVDPGKVTGIAVYDPKTEAFESQAFTQLLACDYIDYLLVLHGHVVLAVERFTLGGARPQTPQPEALEIIGVARWLARRHDARFVLQGAADASRAGSREILQRIGWWKAADLDQQRNKASAQVALALLTTSPDAWERLITGGSIATGTVQAQEGDNS